jgi:hypothetical protein
LRSLQVESKAKIWHLIKIIHLLPLINRGGFQALSKKKSKAKVGGKSTIFLVFFLSSQALSHRFLLFHYQAFIVIATSSHTSDFLAPLGMSSASLLLWSGKPSSSFTLPPGWLLHAMTKEFTWLLGQASNHVDRGLDPFQPRPDGWVESSPNQK